MELGIEGREQLWRIWHYLHTTYGAGERDAIRIICYKWQYYWQAFSTDRRGCDGE